MPAPGTPDPGTGARPGLLGRLSALLGAPLLLAGRPAGILAAADPAPRGNPGGPTRGIRIAAPDHSVKRRG